MSATVTLKEKFSGRNGGLGHRVVMDGPAEAGGSNAGFRPMELMLLGLGFCMGYDMVMILRRMPEEVTVPDSLTGQRSEEPQRVTRKWTLEHCSREKESLRDRERRWSWPSTIMFGPRMSPRPRP